MSAQSEIVDFKALAQRVKQDAKGCARVLVGIDGPGASGKSTFAQQLAISLDGANIVPVDDFFLPKAERNARASEVGSQFDLPRLARQVITPARTVKAFSYQRYDWTQDRLADWIIVPEAAPIIVEGVFSLVKELRDAYTYKVWCRADSALRLTRGLARDGEQARSLWLNDWMPAEDEYAIAQKPEQGAELVVDSSSMIGDHPVFRYTLSDKS